MDKATGRTTAVIWQVQRNAVLVIFFLVFSERSFNQQMNFALNSKKPIDYLQKSIILHS